MKISINKILAGFAINVLIVVASAVIFAVRFEPKNTFGENLILNWVEFSLFIFSTLLLAVVYYIVRRQVKARNISENLLLENKKLFQDFIDSSPNGIIVKRIDGDYVIVNKKFVTLSGIENPEEIIGKTDQEFLPKNLADINRYSDYEVAKAGRPFQTEENFDLDNVIYTYMVDKFPMYDTNARLFAIGGIYTDITERKRLEKSLIAGNKFFDMSVDIMIIGSMEKFIRVNPLMSKTLGYSEEELLNGTFFSFLLPEDHEISRQELAKLQTGALSVQFENRWVCKDGSVKTISWSVSPEVSTGLIYAVGRDVTAQKETEKSLQSADKFFNLSFEMLVEIEGDHFSKVNPAFTKTLGYTQTEIIGVPFMTLTHPDDVEATKLAFEKLINGEFMDEYRVRVQAKDGSYKWLNWTGSVDIQTGKVYIVARDVSQLIEKEESLLIANTFFELSFDAFVVVEEDKLIKINPAFTQISGYDQNDLEKISYLNLIRPDYVNIMKERLDKRKRGEFVNSKITVPLLPKDGSLKWVELNSSTDKISHKSYSVLRDVTERELYDEKLKILNQQLKDEQEQINSIFEHAPDPVIVIDADSRVIRWNPRAEAVFGWSAKEAIGAPIYEKIVPPRFVNSHKKGMTNYLLTGHGPLVNATTEMMAINKQGLEFPVSLSISPIKMNGKDFFIGFARDITIAKKALDDLEKNEKKLKLILENIGEGVIVANPEHEIILVNDVVSEIYETTNNQDISPNLSSHFELFFPDGKNNFPAQDLPMEKALEGKTTDDLDIIIVNPVSHRKRRVLLSGKPLLDENKKLIVAVVTIKDITKYKELEEELKQSEQKVRQLIGYKA